MTHKIPYIQDKYDTIIMEIDKGRLWLNQPKEDLEGNKIEDTVIINDPYDFIAKILYLIESNNSKMIYKRLRKIEARLKEIGEQKSSKD